jgi:AraC family transcriptional regulator, exoenzyme S synthesis regulatory protein ExsA
MQPPDSALLELKFQELLLNVADNPKNRPLMTYLSRVLQKSSDIALREIMEANYCYNLPLEAYAQLSNRSLSTFKRDFQKIYHTTPGKWLSGQRLAHAKMLLTNSNQTVSEIAYASGFENLSHFSRAFREKFGAAPVALRMQSAG